jgi:hypothetical protein
MVNATVNGGMVGFGLASGVTQGAFYGYSTQGTLLSGDAAIHKGDRSGTPPSGFTCGAP